MTMVMAAPTVPTPIVSPRLPALAAKFATTAATMTVMGWPTAPTPSASKTTPAPERRPRIATTTPTPVTDDPDDRDQSDPDIYIFRGAQFITAGTGPDDNIETFTTPTLQAGQTYIAAIEEWRFDDEEAAASYPDRICMNVSFSPTP